jgi:hypothetical protein
MCNLPSEIWTRIAFFACTDGGRMGAVLQQVSKLVAYGTAVHKNNIIALHIVERAKLCSDYLGSDNQNLKPVHHLLLDTSHSDTSLPRRTARIIQLRILHIVSPYLRSLTVITKARLDETSKSLNFPHLESLSLNCCLLITSAPKLLSLHLTIRPNTLIDCLQFVVELRSRTPAIKHITIVDLAPLCLGYAQLLGNIRLEFETETPSDIVGKTIFGKASKIALLHGIIPHASAIPKNLTPAFPNSVGSQPCSMKLKRPPKTKSPMKSRAM